MCAQIFMIVLVGFLFSIYTESKKADLLELEENYTKVEYDFAAEPKTLLACLFIENSVAGRTYYGYQKAAAAMDIALNYSNELILPKNLQLTMQHINIGSECLERNHLAAMMMHLIDEEIRCDVIIGPGCGYGAESLYDVTSFYKIPMIGCPAASVGTQGPIESYTYITRISFTHINTARILIRFCNEYNYTSLMFLQDQTVMMFKHLSIVIKSTFFAEEFATHMASRWTNVNDSQWSDEMVKDYLLSAQSRSRVFVLICHSNVVRRFMVSKLFPTERFYMVMASRLGMTTGEYVFMAVELWENVYWGDYSSYQRKDGNDQITKKAFEVLLLVTLHNRNDLEFANFARRVKEMSWAKGYYNYTEKEEVDVLVSHFYDSVIYFSTAVTRLIKMGKNYSDADQFFDLILNTNFTFTSPITGRITMDENGDRESSYVIRNFNPISRKFEDLWYYPAGAGTRSLLGKLNWPGRKPLPANRPSCGYLGDDPACQPKPMSMGQIAAAVIAPLLLVCILATVGSVVAQRIYAKNVDPFWWRVFVTELAFPSNAKTANGTSVFQSTPGLAKSKSTLNESAVHDDNMSKHMGPDPTAYRQEAILNGNTVELRQLDKPLQKASPNLRLIFDVLKRIIHLNVQKFYAIGVSEDHLCEYFVGESCSKGSLHQLLSKAKFNLDWNFKHSIIKDLTNGMNFLHSTPIVSHGNLNAHLCRIDSTFTLKIADYGMGILRNQDDLRAVTEMDDERDFESLLWRAPEHLRVRMPAEGTPKGDVYSFSITLQQIILRSPPFRNNNIPARVGGEDFSPREIVMEVKKGGNPPLRPRVPNTACPPALLDVLERCWDETPAARPVFSRLREMFASQFGHSGDSIVEHLILRMEQEAAELEMEAEDKMKLLLDEKRRSDDILSQILPKSVALALTQGKQILPETFASTTVHFSDIEGFPELIAEAQTPADTVYILNTLYTTCDNIIEKYDVYKVETVKDAYLVVSGLPIRNGIKHAGEIASMGLFLKRDVNLLQFKQKSPRLRLRVGIHSGPCVSAIIGTKMPRYCLFGDTVNTSSRMESHGEPGKIQCSEATKDLLDKLGGFVVLPRGEIVVKGKGPMNTFWVIAKD